MFRALTLAVATCLVSCVGVCNAAVEFTLNFDSTSFSSNSPATGASASVGFEFIYVDANTTTIKLHIENTTGTITQFGAGATSSTLTGVGFDLLGYTFVTGSFVPGSKLDNYILNAAASPFDALDIAATDDQNYNGAGPGGPAGVLASLTDMVSFNFTGADATTMAAAFKAAFYPLDAEDVLQAAVRFQQVDGDDDYDGESSDKLEFRPPVPPLDDEGDPDLPEPVSLLVWAGLSGVVGLTTIRRRQGA